MKKFATMLAMSLTMVFAANALAHPEHDDVPPTLKPVKLEAKSTANGVTLLVTLNGEAYATAGAAGTLTVTKGKRQEVVQLKPSGDNALATVKPVKIAKGSKAKADIAFPDDSIAQVDVVVK
jgi:hypothetical protein